MLNPWAFGGAIAGQLIITLGSRKPGDKFKWEYLISDLPGILAGGLSPELYAAAPDHTNPLGSAVTGLIVGLGVKGIIRPIVKKIAPPEQ